MASVNNATSTSSSSTSSSYSYLQYKNKIGGLVSGMDIDSIMEKLMKAESAQMEKLQQQKQKYEWTRDAYREVNTKLNTFQQDLFDKYGLKSSWNSKTATTSANDAVVVKANSSASGNLSITQVKMATAASGKYTSSGKESATITANTNIADITGFGKILTIFNKGTNVTNESDKLTTVNDILDVLKDNGYTANVSDGKLTIAASSDATLLDDTTKSSLESLGFSFGNYTQQLSNSLTYQDASNNTVAAVESTKLSDLNLNSGVLELKSGTATTSISLTDLGPNATVVNLLDEINTAGYSASITDDGKLSIFSGNSNDNLEITVSGNNQIQFNTAMSLGEIESSAWEEPTPSSKFQGSNTIKDVVGLDAIDGMLTFKAVQNDGSMKETTITYKATDTIDSLITKINSSGAGITALFNDGQFSITANNAGENKTGGAEVALLSTVKDNGASIENIQGKKLFSKLMGKEIGTEPEITLADGGSNSSITVNGVTYNQSSNVFNIAGYEITATGNLADTTATGASSKVISVSVSNDVDKAVEKVTSFVDMYNSLIKELNDKTIEKKKIGYDPLTDAQKAEMSESEITKWETAAKAGLLKGDTTLTSVISKMRQTLFTYGTSSTTSTSNTTLGIKGETLSSIGITTSSTWTDNGKLEIDEDKLRAALEKDPDIVARIFTGDGTTSNPGIVSQLRTTAQTAVKSIENSAGKDTSASETSYSIGKTISSLTTKIEDWKDRLKDIEERYWNQFSAMETAIQKANSQSSIFSSGSY